MATLMGVDIGQKRDPTAICVAETKRREGDHRSETHYLIRFLERLPLGTPYPQVAQRIDDVAGGVRAKTEYSPTLYVDATGVGTPVVDILRSNAPNVRHVTAVYFTYGDRRKVEHGHISLGKAWLVSRLQALLQTLRIHLPRTSEAEALARELQDYEIRVDENANDRYGAFRVGTHDDLVTALGLAVQCEPPIPNLQSYRF